VCLWEADDDPIVHSSFAPYLVTFEIFVTTMGSNFFAGGRVGRPAEECRLFCNMFNSIGLIRICTCIRRQLAIV